MECYNHPDREATTTCSVCGKAICPECSMEIAGNVYCKDCVNEIVTKSIMEKTVAEAPKATEEVETVAEAPKATEEVETVAEPKEEEIIEEPVETITPLKTEEAEEVEEPVPAAPAKPAENFEPEIEYETEYVETYDDDGMEDSYYENPELIPEPEPEYKEREKALKQQKMEEKEFIEPKHNADLEAPVAGLDDEYYEEVPNGTPSTELEAKYEKYLEDLYYDEDEIVEEAPIEARRQSRPRRPERDDAYYDENHRRSPRNYSNQGEYYINPREEEFEDEYITPAGRSGPRNQEAESYEELKRRIERNYAKEQEAKQNRRFRRSKKSKKQKRPEYDEFESIQEMHRFPDEEYEDDGGIRILDIILAIILILLIIAVLLYVIYLFRLNGEYFSFFDSLMGLFHDPSSYISNVLNLI